MEQQVNTGAPIDPNTENILDQPLDSTEGSVGMEGVSDPSLDAGAVRSEDVSDKPLDSTEEPVGMEGVSEESSIPGQPRRDAIELPPATQQTTLPDTLPFDDTSDSDMEEKSDVSSSKNETDISRMLKQYTNGSYILVFPFCSKKNSQKKK